MNKLEYLWNEEDIALIQKLHAEGMSYGAIGERINRSAKAVRVKLKRLSMTPEQIYEYNKKERLRGKKYIARATIAGVRENVRPENAIPTDVLTDREARLAAPRDLTGTFFGDPPKGFSALERRV